MLELTLVSVEARTAGGEVPTDISFGRPRSHVELICPPATTLASTLGLSEGDFRNICVFDVLECASIGILHIQYLCGNGRWTHLYQFCHNFGNKAFSYSLIILVSH